jgi:hypothetical protein
VHEGPGERTRPRGRDVLALLLLSVLVYNLNLREISSADTFTTRLVPLVLILDQRLSLDRFFRGDPATDEVPYYVQYIDGHYVSPWPILPALLAVPVYFVPVRWFDVQSWRGVNLLSKLTASLLGGLSVAMVYLALREVTHRRAALAISLVYAFGTSTWSISSQGLWGHGPAQLALAAGLWLVFRRPRGWFETAAGLCAGLMVAARPAAVVLAASVIACVCREGARSTTRCLAGFASVVAAVVWYNLALFGALEGGYARINAAHWNRHGVDGTWSADVLQGVAGLLVSPNRGLLVYAPVLAFALVGLGKALGGRRSRDLQLLAAGWVANLLMLGAYAVWWGGHSFGPRLLADSLPALVMLLVTVWEAVEGRRWVRIAFLVLFVASVWVQSVGAFYYPSPPEVDWNRAPEDVDQAHARLWDWRDTQLLRLLRNGPHAPGFATLR